MNKILYIRKLCVFLWSHDHSEEGRILELILLRVTLVLSLVGEELLTGIWDQYSLHNIKEFEKIIIFSSDFE